MSLKMTPAEIERSCIRLSTCNKREVHLKPLFVQRKITQEQQAHSIKHLYDDSIAHREQRIREIEERASAEISRFNVSVKKLDEAEVEDMVRHLYNESIEKKKNTMEMLYERERSLDVRTTKKLGKKQHLDAVERLYNKGMEHNREKHIALYEKFVLARQPKSVIRTPEELLESCDKMYKGEGLTVA